MSARQASEQDSLLLGIVHKEPLVQGIRLCPKKHMLCDRKLQSLLVRWADCPVTLSAAAFTAVLLTQSC